MSLKLIRINEDDVADGNDAEGGGKAKQQQKDSLKSKAGTSVGPCRRPPAGLETMNEPPPVKRVAPRREPSPDFSFFM